LGSNLFFIGIIFVKRLENLIFCDMRFPKHSWKSKSNASSHGKAPLKEEHKFACLFFFFLFFFFCVCFSWIWLAQLHVTWFCKCWFISFQKATQVCMSFVFFIFWGVFHGLGLPHRKWTWFCKC
jgi:hypothetical protein